MGALRFYHGDHLGSSNVITDGTGTPVELAEYSPYGSLNRHDGSVDVPQKFTGQRVDQTTGLYFYNARYYDPSLGRFVQPDTIVQAPGDPQTLNRYSYVRDNPLKYIDSTGHSFWEIFKRVYVALITLGMSETVPLTTQAIVSLSEQAGIDPRYPLALYSAAIGAATGGIGWGVGAAISGAATSFGTSLAMDTGTGRQITRKVAEEFFMDVVGMSPRAAYTAAAITVSTAIAAGIQLLGSAAIKMREAMWEQSTINPKNATKISAGFKGDGHGLAGSRWDASKPDGGSSWLGGPQGGPGKFFGIPYSKGSGLDLLLETFAGPHDYLNNLFTRDYDAAGNIRQGLSAFEKGVAGVMNGVDVPLSVPFGVAGTVAPEGTAGIAAAGLTVDQSKHLE